MSSNIKTVNILGVTGSVGQCATDVILSAPEKFNVQTVTAHSNAKALAEAAKKLNARKAVLADEENFETLKSELAGSGIEAYAGGEALLAASSEKIDLTLVAIVGMAGLRPTIAAIQNSKAIAIANKEPLAAAGALVMREAKKSGAVILPVDSEHNAIFQVFESERPQGIEKIILTASGGPFRNWTQEQMARATKEQALSHPNWSMGPKITIDSATMMNKALEIIEAHYLFAMPPEKIEVLVHPQSVIHSMVEYKDGSVLAQMGASDMRTPVAYVLGWPERISTPGRKIDWRNLKELTFEQPDHERFLALRLAYKALEKGPYACVALNAANEIAVDAFLNKKTGFLDIIETVETIMNRVPPEQLEKIDDFENLDQLVRQQTRDYINQSKTQKVHSRL